MSQIHKIALGTVQFGLDYGIANHSGKSSLYDVKSILALALENNVTTLDTAVAYGNSEAVLGSVGVNDFELISKLPTIKSSAKGSITRSINQHIHESLSRLSIDSLNAILLHDPSQLLHEEGKHIFKGLQNLKDSKIVKSIGVSVYHPDECHLILKKYAVDIVQIPFNIFDERWEQSILDMKNKNIEIHVRSIFLQGLLVMSPNLRPEWFNQWSDLWHKWSLYLNNTKQTGVEACVHYALSRPEIDKVIVGVESVQQFKMILAAVESAKTMPPIPINFQTDDEMLLNPSNWPSYI